MVDDKLEELVQSVRAKASYSQISEDLIRWLGKQELAKRRNLKEAVKHTRSKLHQSGGAYLESKPDYARWRAELVDIPPNLDDPALQAFCQKVMLAHASTRERLPILERFFQQTLADAAPIGSILDLGCGMNPLSIPWIPGNGHMTYLGLDIYADMATFLNDFFDHLGISGRVQVYNLLQGLPADLPKVRVAMLLKTVTCLELIDHAVTTKLLDGIQADFLLISYPVHSLGGRSKGMRSTYEKHFAVLAAEHHWQAKCFEFETELAYLIRL